MSMGYRHDPDAVLAAAVRVAGQGGLTGLTFRAVARPLGIADRTVVYYFPTKQDLVTAVLAHMTTQLRDVLTAALNEQQVSPEALLDTCWQALRGPEGEVALRLYVEALGLAAAGQEPYRTAMTGLTTIWAAWMLEHLDAPAGRRQDQAAAVLAVLDGLLVLRVASGTDMAEGAFRGIRHLAC